VAALYIDLLVVGSVASGRLIPHACVDVDGYGTLWSMTEGEDKQKTELDGSPSMENTGGAHIMYYYNSSRCCFVRMQAADLEQIGATLLIIVCSSCFNSNPCRTLAFRTPKIDVS